MRWSIIRLIWLRDLRDQLRDRRTLFMVVVLPLLLYPVLGFVVLKFALGFAEQPSVIGIVGSAGQDFPERNPHGRSEFRAGFGVVVGHLGMASSRGGRAVYRRVMKLSIIRRSFTPASLCHLRRERRLNN